MQAYYRNKTTGEIKLVEQDSPEMFGLQKEVGASGEPKWEQTSFAHAAAIKERASYGELDEADLGEEHQAALRERSVALVPDAGPEAQPHLALTPGEIEAGLTPEQKAEDLKSMFRQDEVDGVTEVLENAADAIADERKERAPAQESRGLRARAGGSDEREGVAVATADDPKDKGKKSGPSAPSGSEVS